MFGRTCFPMGFFCYFVINLSGLISQDIGISYFYNDIDAALIDKRNRFIFLFKDQYYLKIRQKHWKISSGFPIKISGNFQGRPYYFDAVTRFSKSGNKWYGFKGDQCWRFSSLNPAEPDEGYPRNISQHLNDLPDFFKNNYDATLFWPKGEILYIFKGSEYGIYSKHKFLTNSTRLIATDWHGLPSKVDAAVFIKKLNAGYVFRKEQYWRVDVANKMADKGYPKPILDFLNRHEQGISSNCHSQGVRSVRSGFSSLYYRNRRVKGHIIKRYVSNGVADCFQKCLEEKGFCQSINLGNTTSVGGPYECELNNIRAQEDSRSLVRCLGFVYYDVIGN